MERFAQEVTNLINEHIEGLPSPLRPADLEMPPNPQLGDFAFPCFRLAKSYRKKPAEIATDLQKKLEPLLPKALDVTAAGPYLNFKVSESATFNEILDSVLSGDKNGTYGKLPPESRLTWVLEYSSPNVAKPFQIYHLRPTALGSALDRIGRYRGHKMISVNHLGDWGTQYGKLAVALRLFADDLPTEPTIKDLVEIYVRFHKEAESRPELEDEARSAFKKLEEGDAEMQGVWKRCVDISMKEFLRIYDRIDTHFDHFWGESHYQDFLAPLIDELRQKEILIESEGAWVVPVEDKKGKELAPCIIQKSDGATLYATRDLAAAIYRKEKLNFDRMTYIVGGEQKLHFQQVFCVLQKMGHQWIETAEHVPTGLYRFKDAKMSTRSGNFVTLEDTIELAKERVHSLMEARAEKVQDRAVVKPTEEITEAIAVGAVVFHDLHHDPARDVEFDIERVVDFEGETGPYMQYAHTRCLSIFRKAESSEALSESFRNRRFSRELIEEASSLLGKDSEVQLVKTLGRFPLFLEKTLEQRKASQLANYLIDVTKCFNGFYRECKVIDWNESKTTHARLLLVEATRRVLGQGLQLLGIPLPDRM